MCSVFISYILFILSAQSFHVISSQPQSDDRLMTEKEKYEVLDSLCAVTGWSIYDHYVYSMDIANDYLLSEREELADSLMGVLNKSNKNLSMQSHNLWFKRRRASVKMTCKMDNSSFKSTYELHKLNPQNRYGLGDFVEFEEGKRFDVNVNVDIARPPYEEGLIVVSAVRLVNDYGDLIEELTPKVYDIKAELLSNPKLNVVYSFKFDYKGSSYEISGHVVSPEYLRVTSIETAEAEQARYRAKLKKIK